MYHHVGPVTDENERKYFISPDMFARQVSLIKEKGFHALTLEEVEEAFLHGTEIPDKSVLITLDDGWLDNYEYAYPIAKESGVPITIFLSTALTGCDPELLSWEQVREMRESGLVSFASHGATHKRLRNLSDNDITAELTQSKQTLEEFFGKPVVSFCYPFGAVDSRVRPLVFKAGYKLDYGTRKGLNRWPWTQRKPLLRAHVFNDESLEDFFRELTRGRK